MDIKREPPPRRNKYLAWGVAIVAVVAGSIALSRLSPAAPSLEAASVMVDSVRRGNMSIDVHAPGTLVPEHVRIIAAVTAGRVEELPLRPGATVTPAMTVVQLSNTDVELQAMQSEQQLAAAMSSLASLKTSLGQQRLTQEAAVAQTTTEFGDAMRNATVMEALDKSKLASGNEVAAARDRAREYRKRLDIEHQRLSVTRDAEREQLALMQDQIVHLRAIVAAQRQRVSAMHVVAGETGQLQVLPLELGQWVNPGMELARVAQPGKLKAVLHVSEEQARDAALGQRAMIDTRNGVVPGHVMRMDPSSQNGTVTVEVAIDGPLPAGTRSDLSVDGTIEIAQLPNVLYVGRPAYGDAERTVGLFRLDPDGKGASRVQVKLGRASANTVEVRSGLRAGDRVITSDMSAWDHVPHVRLK